MKLRDLFTSIKVGAPVHNLGLVDEIVIRYKDKFIIINENTDGEIASLSWAADAGLTHVPVREFWKAEAPVSDLQLKAQDTKGRQAEASSAEKQREA